LLQKILFIVLLSFVASIAQQYNFIRYDVKDGLALSQISKLETFSDGRLFIATYGGGLNIYDGQSFELLNTTNGLANNNIYCVVKQGNDIFWIGTEKGLSKISDSQIINFYKKDGLPSDFIWSLALGKDSVLWIGTDKGLVKYENGSLQKINNELISDTPIWSLFSDSKGNLWIGSRDHMIIYNFRNNRFEKRDEFKNYTFQAYIEDKDGTIWAGTNNGLIKIKNENYKIFTINDGLTNEVIWSIFLDIENNLWVGTEEGVSLYSNGKFNKIGAAEGLTDYKIWDIKPDLENNIWIGTDEGLYKLTDMSFRLFKGFNGKPIDAWTILEKSNNEYLLGSELLGVISFKDQIFKNINIGDINVRGLSSLFIDRSNFIWVASEKGICRYPENSFKRNNLSYMEINGEVSHIMQDSSGRVIFATFYDGTIIYDGKEFNKLKSNTEEVPIVFYHHLDSHNRLWAATSYGLQLVTEDSTHIPPGFEWMEGYSFLNIIEDDRGYLWAGSYEGGMFAFNSNNIENPIFDTVSIQHGLNNNSVMATTFDSENNLWISTNGGFNKLNINEYHSSGYKDVLSYDLNDGFPGIEGYQNGILTDSQQNVLISTIGGLVIFDPRKIVVNKKKPTVKIKNIKIVDRDFNEIFIEKDEIRKLGKNYLELPYDNNNLTIEFVGISLTNPPKVKYSYKLGDNEWSEPTNLPRAYLTNLPYGKYTFKVKASNNNGIWSNEFGELNFELIAPFWYKVWFQILAVLTFIGLILLFYLYRISRMNRVNKDLEERIEERIKYETKLLKSEKELRVAKEAAEKSNKLKSEFLAQMSHEIRTPINSILSYTSLLKEDVDDKIDHSLKDGFSIIQNSSHRLIKTIDSILNMSQIQTGSFELNKKNQNLCKILSDIHTEFKNIAAQKNLKLDLVLESTECFIVIDQYTITQMIANLVDNAIKYTNKGKIEIKLTKPKQTKVIVEISDTGIGMSEEFQKKIFDPFTQEEQGYTRKYDGAGLGLALVMKYAKLNGVKLSFTSIKAVGTTFKVEF